MDITTEYCIEVVRRNRNSTSTRGRFLKRYYAQKIEEEISGLRFTANKMRGTAVGRVCNSKANSLEKSLNWALGINDAH